MSSNGYHNCNVHVRVLDTAQGGIYYRHGLASEVHEHLRAGAMRLSYYDVKLAHPLAVVGAELAVLDPIEVCLLAPIPRRCRVRILCSRANGEPIPSPIWAWLWACCVARMQQMLHIIPSHGIRDRLTESSADGSPDHAADSTVGKLQLLAIWCRLPHLVIKP